MALWLLACGLRVVSAAEMPHTAFYYGEQPPADLLMQYDRVIVEAAQLDAADRAAISRAGAQLYAYLSVGEAEPWRSNYSEFDPAWRLGHNEAWRSEAADLTASGYREMLLRRAGVLWEQGYRGFFLDALDSYLPFTEGAARRAQSDALAEFILALKERYPDASLIANRGFEVIERVEPLLDGLVVESLFAAFEPRSGSYRDVPEEDRYWLLDRLEEVRALRADLPITVIDYLPDARDPRAAEVVEQISDLGLIPWIADGHHLRVGRGLLQTVPRRVLLVYDGQAVDGSHADISDSIAHRLLALPLEYLGYVPEYVDLRKGLPQGPLADRYAGVATWFDRMPPAHLGLRSWLLRQIGEGLPLAVFGQWGIPHDEALYRATGLPLPIDGGQSLRGIAAQDDWIGFENPPVLIGKTLAGYPADLDRVAPHLQIESRDGLRVTGVLTADWGGVALDPWVLYEDYRGRSRWQLNPFEFLRRALKLADIPVPDVTTENGRRLLIAHIDGDGFPSRAAQPGTPFAAEVIEREILDRYRLPHTISVIEGEINRDSAAAESADELEAIARRILSRPLVRPASHTYSHPFRWGDLSEGQVQPEGYNLPLLGYVFDYQRELRGSLDYVSQHLLDGRDRAEVLQLSGDCRPNEVALAVIAAAGAIAVNGGDNEVYPDFPSLTQLSGMARPVGEQLQVYAPLANENVYTDGFQPPWDGYRAVLHTMRFTESPRRLKPINIYYHFYSGTQPAALAALQEVYDWAMTQETRPTHLAEYAGAVVDFRGLGLARAADGSWRISAAGALRTLRLPPGQRVDLSASRGIAGYRCGEDGCRLHLDGRPRASLQLSEGKPRASRPALRQSNGGLHYWQPVAGGARFRLQAYQPLLAEFHTAGKRCVIERGGQQLQPKRQRGGLAWFEFASGDSGDAALLCQ